eukprot:7207-Heterococcus_DN1.PRE.3
MCLFVLIRHSTEQQVATASSKAHLGMMRCVYVNVCYRCSNSSGRGIKSLALSAAVAAVASSL